MPQGMRILPEVQWIVVQLSSVFNKEDISIYCYGKRNRRNKGRKETSRQRQKQIGSNPTTNNRTTPAQEGWVDESRRNDSGNFQETG
jgi:hypothetical protein